MKLPQMIRNLWIYRRVLLLAVLLGVVLYFVATNNRPLTVSFPVLGDISSTAGIVMLVSAALGAVGSWLVLTFRQAVRQARQEQQRPTVGTENHVQEPGQTTGTEAGRAVRGEPQSGNP